MADHGMGLDVAARTDIGLKRKRNEDHLGFRIPEPGSPQHDQGALFVVADGMGGMGGGDVASQTAVAEIFQRYYADPSLDALSALRQALEYANTAVRAQAERVRLPRIGSTAAGLALLKHTDLSAKEIAVEALRIAADLCVFTNDNISLVELTGQA